MDGSVLGVAWGPTGMEGRGGEGNRHLSHEYLGVGVIQYRDTRTPSIEG